MILLCSLLLLGLPLHAGELIFPKLEDAKRIHGELVSADFIHRRGQFRTDKGELIAYTMPPYAIMKYRGAAQRSRQVTEEALMLGAWVVVSFRQA